MAVSVVVLLGILGWFKYYGFVSVNLDNVSHAIGLGRAIPLLQVGLPIAISFFTFMAISYVIMTSTGASSSRPSRSTSRCTSTSPASPGGADGAGGPSSTQIRRRRDPDGVDYSRAFSLILAGLFKKVVISFLRGEDAIVAPVFTSPSQHSAPEAIFAAWGYAVQIYCDFSDSDIAIGLALLLGFRFPQNFGPRPTRPQPAGLLAALAHDAVRARCATTSTSRSGATQAARPRPSRNIMITMMLGGLWHGAAWTFVVWGALQEVRGRASGTCAAPAGSAWLPPVADGPVRVWVQRFLTLQFVCLGWVFFDATGMSAFAVIGRVFAAGRALAAGHPAVGRDRPRYHRRPVRADAQRVPPAGRVLPPAGAVLQVGVLGLALLGVTTLGPVGVAPFIYYRF